MKNSSENKTFAVFIILSFLVYIMSNGEWCIPIFAWIYPILFLCMIYLNRTRKVYLIICSAFSDKFCDTSLLDAEHSCIFALISSISELIPDII